MNSNEVYAFINRLSVETIVLLAYQKFKILFGILAFLPKILLATLLFDRAFYRAIIDKNVKLCVAKNLFFVRPFVKNF